MAGSDIQHQTLFEGIVMVNIYNMDCMEAMSTMETGKYDLAIVDPPYGIHSKLLTNQPLNRSNRFALEYMKKNWDTKRPSKYYFDELIRVSKHQIIWGGNYFADLLPPSRGWICWDKLGDKMTVINNELAWTSFDKAMKMFRRGHWLDKLLNVKSEDIKIHPTQKPVALYTWILSNYAKPGWKILDTHLGSGSSAIAAHDMGFHFDGYELDVDYYNAAKERLSHHERQLKLF